MIQDFNGISAAHVRIAPHVRRTFLAASLGLSERAGQTVSLKHEHHQITGAFKLRGATNAILSLSDQQRASGVAVASTGNHGRGVALAAKRTGTRAVICLSELVPTNKVEAIRALGAEVRIVGRSQDDAQKEVDLLVAEAGLTEIPPFDDPLVVAGQGTIGIEIMDDAPDTGTIVVPLSGGGLISGVACAAKHLNPDVSVIGVTMETGAAMIESLHAGHPVDVEEVPSLADSLGGGIGLHNQLTFNMCQELVDETLTVTEAEIAEAIRFAYFEESEIIEGAAAVGVAAILAGKLKLATPTVLVLSGRNIDMSLHRRILNGETPDRRAS